jgi:hypothetical protein
VKRLLAVAAVPLLVPFALVPVLNGAAAGSAIGGEPTAVALAEIPPAYLAAYRSAASTCTGLPWSVLAAIGWIETRHGSTGGATTDASGDVAPRIIGVALDGRGGTAAIRVPAGGSPWHDDAVWDHAVGPMQFITGTWRGSGRDGSGDGVANPHNAFDAIATAAHYLCGADDRVTSIDEAVLAYNHSSDYLDAVLAKAAEYGSLSAGTAAPDVAALLVNPRVHLSGSARTDLEAGIIDPRLVAALLTAANAGYELGVGVMRTGHSVYVAGTTTVSNHFYGRAVDVHTVNGAPVRDGNQAARSLAAFLLALPAPVRPEELGHPFCDSAALMAEPGSFNNADHEDHLHLGWRTPTP